MSIGLNNDGIVKGYEGIVKGVLQIPLRHFLSDLQTNGSEESSEALPGAATTQSDLPNASNPSKKPSSTSTSKPGPSTAPCCSWNSAWEVKELQPQEE